MSTYGTVTGARDYATARGLVLPVDDADVLELLQRANDLLEAKRYKGRRTVSTQAKAWPRAHVWLDGDYLDSAVVPVQIISAEYQLALDLQTTNFAPVQDGGDLVELTVPGAVTQKWSPGRAAPKSVAANNWLAGLLANGSMVQRA